ncbi:hypothetical protein DVK44_18005 [Streptomyces paludis]|uniref:Uncharacterized protein n=1 Tax=Streptomyces paludis TaxID=2282738 RepID=A0A345HRB5_9ACTN|nr:hypothetical protein DVK44_18005 [Streptomyces paludis]
MVLEVPHLGHARPPWRWFEIDLDHITDHDLIRTPPTTHPVRASAMTRHHEPEAIARHLARPRSSAVTHVQFEVRNLGEARRTTELIRAAGLIPLPAIHCSEPPRDTDDLRRPIALLADLGAPLIKLAYPALDPPHIAAGIAILTEPRAFAAELALIPMGKPEGRAAAYGAGSRLIWAPPQPDGERWTADQLFPRLVPSPFL